MNFIQSRLPSHLLSPNLSYTPSLSSRAYLLALNNSWLCPVYEKAKLSENFFSTIDLSKPIEDTLEAIKNDSPSELEETKHKLPKFVVVLSSLVSRVAFSILIATPASFIGFTWNSFFYLKSQIELYNQKQVSFASSEKMHYYKKGCYLDGTKVLTAGIGILFLNLKLSETFRTFCSTASTIYGALPPTLFFNSKLGVSRVIDSFEDKPSVIMANILRRDFGLVSPSKELLLPEKSNSLQIKSRHLIEHLTQIKATKLDVSECLTALEALSDSDEKEVLKKISENLSSADFLSNLTTLDGYFQSVLEKSTKDRSLLEFEIAFNKLMTPELIETEKLLNEFSCSLSDLAEKTPEECESILKDMQNTETKEGVANFHKLMDALSFISDIQSAKKFRSFFADLINKNTSRLLPHLPNLTSKDFLQKVREAKKTVDDTTKKTCTFIEKLHYARQEIPSDLEHTITTSNKRSFALRKFTFDVQDCLALCEKKVQTYIRPLFSSNLFFFPKLV